MAHFGIGNSPSAWGRVAVFYLFGGLTFMPYLWGRDPNQGRRGPELCPDSGAPGSGHTRWQSDPRIGNDTNGVGNVAGKRLRQVLVEALEKHSQTAWAEIKEFRNELTTFMLDVELKLKGPPSKGSEPLRSRSSRTGMSMAQGWSM